MTSSLIDFYASPADQATYVVVDFETVTPTGRPAEPIELAALRLGPGLVRDRSFQFSRLIRPPDGAPLTPFDVAQTGIQWRDLEGQPDAVEVLAEFERLQTAQQICVAQNASYEANVFARFSSVCPTTAGLPFVDTVALARKVLPDLRNHRLDTLADHLRIPIPHNRHRALPDVQITLDVFVNLIRMARASGIATRVGDLIRVAGVSQKRTSPQSSLF